MKTFDKWMRIVLAMLGIVLALAYVFTNHEPPLTLIFLFIVLTYVEVALNRPEHD